jgi:Phage protein U
MANVSSLGKILGDLSAQVSSLATGVGNLGTDIVFRVSRSSVLTFKNLKQEVGGQWGEHKVIGGKAKLEFGGVGLRTASLEITIDAALRAKPRDILKLLEKAVEEGEANYLVIGGHKFGNCMWVITEISESWDIVLNRGELARATVNLTLKEYV